MRQHSDRRGWSRPVTGATLILAIAGSLLVLNRANAQQITQPTLQQRQTPQQAFRQFARCVRAKAANCLTNLSSTRGVYLGVDASLASKHVFQRQLTSGKTLPCLFWGVRCSTRVSETCSFVKVLDGSTVSIDYTRPVLYKDRWQLEITVRDPSRKCAQDLPIVWSLENGLWRMAAIPYT